MKTRLLTTLLSGLALVSCDKVKTIADKAKTITDKAAAMVGEAAKTDDDPSSTVDPELEKLVDRTDEGVIFRKDLPFPARLEVNETSRSLISTRLTETSAMGKSARMLKGLMVSTHKLERSGDHVRFTAGVITISDPTAEGPENKTPSGASKPPQTIAASPSLTFNRANGVWNADPSSGFAGVALAKDLAPVFDLLLQENGLAPRPMWFGKRRIKIGDEIEISGKSLPMLIGGNAQGSLNLKLESFEPVSGHPCGQFSIHGDYSRKQFPSFDGKFTDEEVSIQSGKVWLSLIHPLALKWEMDTVQTYDQGEKGGSILHGQGSAHITSTSDWKALAP